jgi:formate hydrogenlyase subunit 3/multisubunit Na+/H+ antiporter MnhD subunit
VSFVDNWFNFTDGARNPWFDLTFGRIEVYFAVVFAFIGLMTLLYAIAKVRGRAGRVAEFFVFLFVLVASALGVVFARNLLLVFICWEVATFAIWRLVLYHRTEEAVGAANWTWFVNFAAATLMLVGIAILLFEEKTLSLRQLEGTSVSLLPSLLILIGILAKSATLPLYIWMPKAYRAAPAPVCALLSGIAENIGIVLFYKFFVATVQPPPGFMVFVAGLGLVSSLVAGGVAIQAKTVRGTLAYSTISQLGFIFLGLAMVSYYGILGGLLYVLAHAVAKSGLFFSFGLVEDSTGTGKISERGGMAKRAPVLAAATAMLVFSIIGLPPFLGFFAKLGVVMGALKGSMMLGVGAVVGALFTVIYMVRLYSGVFLGEEAKAGGGRVSGYLTAVVVLMALVSLAGGILAFVPVRLLDQGVVTLLGGM